MNRVVIPFLLLGLLVPVMAGDEAPKKTKTHTVESGNIEVTANASGPLTPTEKVEIRLKPEKYEGGFTVVDAVPSGTVVKKGQVLLRAERKKYDEALKKAKEDLDDAELDFAAQKVEAELAEKKEKLELESAQLTHDLAMHTLERWDKFGSHAMVRNEELGTLSQQNGLDDERQELNQLEDMYKKSELATETKEIVLERARRNIKISDERLAMQRQAEELLKSMEHPDEDRKIKLEAAHQQVEFELTKVTHANEAKKREHALAKAERALKESHEAYDKLVKDGGLLEVVAPRDGLLSHDEMKPGEGVDANKVIMEIWMPDKYELALSADESSVASVSVGSKAEVTVAAAPEAQLTGMVTEMSLVGKVEDQTKYPFKVSITGAAASLRYGMHAKVVIHGAQLKDVLWVPRTAVTTKDGKSTVKVKKGDAEETRTVTLGAGNEDNVVVVKGLAKGDVVCWEEE